MARSSEQTGVSIPVLVIEVTKGKVRIGIATVFAPPEVAELLQSQGGRAANRRGRIQRLHRLAQAPCPN
jgi:hypothetical protein